MDVRQAAISVWEAFFSRDSDRVRAVLADDVEWVAPPGNATAIVLGAPHHMVGADDIVRFILEDVRRLFPNGMDVEPISLTSQGGRVVFEQRQRAVLANGRQFDLAYVFIFEMAGSRVRRIREYMDTAAGLRMVFGDDPPGQIV